VTGNRNDPRGDYRGMTCRHVREAVSAVLDGEDSPLDAGVIESHLASCTDCRAYAVQARTLHRSLRMSAAPAVPDLTPSILAAIDASHRSAAADGRDLALRLALVVLAVAQIAIGIPALLGADSGVPVHDARHLGSFGLALAVGFLFAAWRPDRIGGLLPVVAALVACLLGTSFLDIASGRTAVVSEVGHVTEIVGLVVCWLLARPASLGTPRVAHR
jgi:predicted anti-sigma-YlaC factor YlaD